MTTRGLATSLTTPPSAQTPIAARPHGSVQRFRNRVLAKLGRLRRWEFWPSWAVYGPMVPYFVYLAMKHRGLTTCTGVNPAIPFGGIVGESKYDILRLFPEWAIVPTLCVEPGDVPERTDRLTRFMNERRWAWPIILKPDQGCRGSGVRLIHNADAAKAYLSEHPGRIIAQSFHPGPHEAGVFYIRPPGASKGSTFSITDKRFAVIEGNGRSSLRSLIWQHPRFRLQAATYLKRLGDRADQVPGVGERVSLGMAGNHCQGTMFLDGARLITPELTDAFDTIARHSPGIDFGRFDVRYSDEQRFRQGKDFQIVEFNGLLSESTNIYQPDTGFWAGQRVLRAQWRHAYEIGSGNRASGHAPATLAQLAKLLRSHATAPARDTDAD